MEQNELDRISDEIIASATKLKKTGDKKLDPKKLEELIDRENRWHEVSMNQLSFYNNLLILLATGYVAFVIKEFDLVKFQFNATFFEKLNVVLFSVLFMALSCFTGLLCGFNRMVDFRYTHRTTLFRRRLYDKSKEEYGEGKYQGKKFKWLITYWIKDAAFFKEPDYVSDADKVKEHINGCSELTKKLGTLTRNLLRFQIVFFIMSILLLIISYFAVHVAQHTLSDHCQTITKPVQLFSRKTLSSPKELSSHLFGNVA